MKIFQQLIAAVISNWRDVPLGDNTGCSTHAAGEVQKPNKCLWKVWVTWSRDTQMVLRRVSTIHTGLVTPSQ